ncbi:CPBP family glutamic-type intramembrane protease [Halorussus salilacus]|uniref:CPBP family intramembrane glutamic endopeptidase n=1 Tax=Halorussus salilacus TaxID=2953750 RepID=UPI0020A12614|nr:CPBP family glutamic-type intramembrane protease [Halorussus salilacus]USZ68965.1 CPBP family glutamic-type intramembrane protease [Halorussus salilacus]
MAPAPMYESFAAVTLLVLGLLIVLARASQAMFADSGDDSAGTPAGGGDQRPEDGHTSEVPATGAARIERHRDAGGEWNDPPGVAVGEAGDEADDSENEGPWRDGDETPWGENEAEADARRGRERRGPDPESLTTGALLANVAVSQGFFGAILVGAAWLGSIPLADLGLAVGDPWRTGVPAVGLGAALGVALYVANELSTEVLDATGIEYSEGLREELAPDTPRGWAILLGVVLPVIAGFEELLFRAALVGAFAAGFGVSPWVLAGLSTVAFAVGHGAQGPGGVVVTGVLGFALAAAFVLTGSLVVVVVAHYLVNALEFAVHEGLGIEWA